MIKTIILTIVILFTIGGLGIRLANRNVERVIARERWIKYVVYILIVFAVLSAGFLGKPFYFILILVLLLIGMIEILLNLRLSGKFSGGVRKPILLVIGYFLISIFACLSCLEMTPTNFIVVYFLVAGFDGFSQVIGQMLGKTKLSSKISPNKTIEGFAGGTLVCIGLALFFKNESGIGLTGSALLGVYVSGTALIGDLAASRIKRWLGIKDFSRLLPGHGGVLDRFDGFIFVLACLFPLLRILMN